VTDQPPPVSAEQEARKIVEDYDGVDHHHRYFTRQGGACDCYKRQRVYVLARAYLDTQAELQATQERESALRWNMGILKRDVKRVQERERVLRVEASAARGREKLLLEVLRPARDELDAWRRYARGTGASKKAARLVAQIDEALAAQRTEEAGEQAHRLAEASTDDSENEPPDFPVNDGVDEMIGRTEEAGGKTFEQRYCQTSPKEEK